MIYNRTENDIETARNLIETKVKNFAELTEDDVAKIERGTFTVNTLNRIEQKQAELNDIPIYLDYKDKIEELNNVLLTVKDKFDSFIEELII